MGLLEHQLLVGPPTFYFQALSGSPGVYADRLILPDGYLRISKSIPSQNQEAVYFMGGLEAPAEPDAPLMFEFWQDREFRLHDRIVYHRIDERAPWIQERLYP